MRNSERDFEKEINEARKLLNNNSHKVKNSKSYIAEGGIESDFDLPYSTLPEINTSKWILAEKIK